MNPTTSAPTRVMLALASLTTVAASCDNNAGADKLGGQGEAEPVTLTVAQGSAVGEPPQLSPSSPTRSAASRVER